MVDGVLLTVSFTSRTHSNYSKHDTILDFDIIICHFEGDSPHLGSCEHVIFVYGSAYHDIPVC
jgi:hypothetical protein